MNKEKLYFDSTNGADRICYFKYTPETEPKAIFQMVHGMAEYAERYEALAELLCNNGYVVYIHEHVGHGNSAKDVDHLGLFLDANQSVTLVEDTHKMSGIAKKEYPSLSLNLFGHSMGSFVVRLTASKYGEDYNSLVVCGTGAKDPKVPLGLTILKLMKIFKGKDFKSKFIDKSSFGSYNDRFKPARTPMDWLSVSKANVDHYIASPYCGFLFSLDGYKMLMEVNRDANKDITFKKTPASLPIYLIAGGDDPVGHYGADIPKVCEEYKKAGIKDCTYKLYEGFRHEILCDDCAGEVRKDILAFLERVTG
ncbi:alpha/beta fold hydrolase [uncultured Treponema sp.]|uniref:alpha/beta fold hydrolase n=1 Tax=uncultured Treponema sp. TaxID=162155 RepID=UPI0025F0E697|nr:alpha/beta hydrolase [uncultured Treponema sp.]